MLEWGQGQGLHINKEEVEGNPMNVACQHNFTECIGHLYKHGYRMKYSVEEVEGDDEDQVKKFLVFKAESNIHYLTLEFTEHKAFKGRKISPMKFDLKKEFNDLDPLRKVHDLMAKAQENMEGFYGSTEMKDNYMEIQKELEDFSVEILDQCKNMDQVKILLEHNPDDDDDDELDDSENNWQVALYTHNKRFVSHPNFQQHIWWKLLGDRSADIISSSSLSSDVLGPVNKMRVKRGLTVMKYVPLTLFNFIFCYIFATSADLFRKADLLFVSPEAKRNRLKGDEHESENSGCFERIRGMLHTPLLRVIPYFSFQVLYLILLILSIMHSIDPASATLDKHLYEISLMSITLWISLNSLIDDIINLFRPMHLQSRWNILSLIGNVLLILGAVLMYSFDNTDKPADLPGYHQVNVGRTMVSYGAGIQFFIILRWLVFLEQTGPIVLCVIAVIRDGLRMASVYAVLLLAHGVTFWSLYKPFRIGNHEINTNSTLEKLSTHNFSLNEPNLRTQRGLMNELFWRIIFTTGPEMVNINNNNDATNDFSMDFSHLMGLVLWGVYQIIIYVLMLNLLIAVMNTSYGELWQNAQMEWKFNKCWFLVDLSL